MTNDTSAPAATSSKPRHFPPKDSPSLHITQPTTSEEHTQSVANSTEWRGALALESYLRRELHLAKQDLTRSGGITYWVLVDSAEDVADGADRTILAGCETIRKRALISHNGTISDATCHGVASVFSPPEFRGRGYGERMIRELGDKLRTWQQVEGRMQFSILYSDIGKKFYAKNGWHPYYSSHVHLPPLPLSYSLHKDIETPATHHITAETLAPFCTSSTNLVHQQLRSHPSGSGPAIAMVPNHATLSWHHAREEFVAKELFGKVPEAKGAWVALDSKHDHTNGAPNGNSSDGRKAFAIWNRMWYNTNPTQSKGNTMHILRLDVEPPASSSQANVSSTSKEEEKRAIMALLRTAQQQAADWNMAEIEIWNPSAEVLDACKSLLELEAVPVADSAKEGEEGKWGVLVERERESIACLRWYGDVDAGGEGKGGGWKVDPETGMVEGLVWMANEKFGWC